MTISARRFAEKLREHGNEIRIVSTGKAGDTEYLMKKQYIPVFDKLVSSQGMTFAKTDKAILEKAIAWADIVHFLVPFALSHNGIKIAQRLNVPYTAAYHVQPENITSSIHLQHWRFVNTAIYRWFNFYIYKYCSHIHCPSRFIADELKKHGYKSRLHIISNGVDPDFITERKLPKPEKYKDRFLILTVGRLSIEKRQDILIKAVSLSEYKDKITVLIAGQGPRKAKLERIAAKYGVPVEIGFYPKDRLLDLIAFSDLYVHAAEAEIEAMSCMEAFSGGLVPIIANSKKSATPQFALDENSLFKAGSPKALAEKIDYWIRHDEERRALEKEYTRLGRKYDLDECVREAENMFRTAIEEKNTERK